MSFVPPGPDAPLMPDAATETTIDAFLGGRVEAVQPKQGHHRSGLDAILLAAALAPDTIGAVVDLGAGAGVAGMALAARAAKAEITLVEREPELLVCAVMALARAANAGFSSRIAIVAADLLVAETRRQAGLSAGRFDHAILNPPFRDAASVRASPKEVRARAHVLEQGGIDSWLRAASDLVRNGGTVTIIFPADGLAALLDACSGRLGSLTLLPLHPRPGGEALRVILRGVRGSRAPLRILPGLVLHSADGNSFTPELTAILRDGAGLADFIPEWAERPVRHPRRIA